MSDLMRAGGMGMWFILAFGLATLVTAGLFIWKPSDARLGAIRGLSMATVFSILSGLCAAAAATLHHVAWDPRFADDRVAYLMQGFSETMAPGILGFSLLALAWLTTAVGLRRLGATA